MCTRGLLVLMSCQLSFFVNAGRDIAIGSAVNSLAACKSDLQK